jgi:putative transposase
MRTPRILKNGACYHISARANRKEMILDRSVIKDLFLSVLVRARKKYKFRIENFTVMGNHYHLIMKPAPGESLSRIMQWIMSVFAMAYNARYGLTGHVWGQRFFSGIIYSFKEFIRTCKYIDGNPVAAQMVVNPREWPFGGLWHTRAGCRDIIGPAELYVCLSIESHIQLALPVFYG